MPATLPSWSPVRRTAAAREENRRAFIQAAQAALQPALRKAALRAGCAYWDQQAAMGGSGAMTRWVRAGLASYDYVHFSGLGYKKLADMLYDQLMAEYGNFLKSLNRLSSVILFGRLPQAKVYGSR